jgi:DNA-binding NarL/FixJ family response regulator
VPEPPPIGARSAPLTRRQEEVAVLIARGMTNRQIAKKLSVSENTVANHVAKILKKLRLCSRSQVAAWLVAQRTLPASGDQLQPLR